MIKNIIFDFGDIFFNLDKPATTKKMKKFGFQGSSIELEGLLQAYEKGLLTSDLFIEKVNLFFPKATPNELIDAWNAVLKDFPENRLLFLEAFAKKGRYRLFLLSNTNKLHIDKVRQIMGEQRYERFKKCFEKFYLSHEMHLRKPAPEIYQFVLQENNMKANETFFIDDTQENTEAAALLGIKTWNLKVGAEDIIDLTSRL